MKRAMLFGMALVAGCGIDPIGGEEPHEPLNKGQTLSGSFGGESWTFTRGEARPGFDSNEVRLELYASDFEPCETFVSSGEGKYILTTTPPAPGEYELGLSQSVTFVTPPANNQISLQGLLEIDEVSDTMIKGGLVARFDDRTQVNGRFEAHRCSDR